MGRPKPKKGVKVRASFQTDVAFEQETLNSNDFFQQLGKQENEPSGTFNIE